MRNNSAEGLDVSWSDLLQPSYCRLPSRKLENVYLFSKYLELKCNLVDVTRRPHCREWTSIPRKARSQLKKPWHMGPRRRNRQSSTKSFFFLTLNVKSFDNFAICITRVMAFRVRSLAWYIQGLAYEGAKRGCPKEAKDPVKAAKCFKIAANLVRWVQNLQKSFTCEMDSSEFLLLTGSWWEWRISRQIR